jgi:energy-converting hydrogenase Eha subunit A
MTFLHNKWLQILILVGAATVLLLMPSPLPDYLTTSEFQAYWGASHLLSQGANFADPDLLLQVEQEATGLEDETALRAWNPPWFSAWFLPLGVTTFARASYLWFLTNIVLLFTSSVMLWQTFTNDPRTMRWLWVGLAVSFLFLPTVTTLLVGQITALILFGIAAFLFLADRGHLFLAGAALSLTTAKPHLLYLTLPLVLLELIVRKQWRTVAGFVTPVLAGSLAAFLLRPSFLSDYVVMMTGSGLVQMTAVPTLSSYLAGLLEIPWLRFVGAALLLVGMILWWRSRRRHPISLVQMVEVTLVISLLTTPYAWSFDFILLLVPLLRLTVWSLEGHLPRVHALSIATLAVIANAGFWYQRTAHAPERAYFWFPLVLVVLVGWGWLSVAARHPAAAAR